MDSATPWLLGNGGLYVTGEDNLRLTSFGSTASLTITLEGRVVDYDGCLHPVAQTQLPNSDRSVKQTVIPLGRGWLTNVQVRLTGGTARRGQCFVTVELVRGREGSVQPLGTLLQDYATGNAPIAWPGSPIRSPFDGAGFPRSITGTDPAAGVEVSESVPTNARWRLLSVQVQLVTSAVVANRGPALTIDDGTANTVGRYPNAGTIAASLSSAVSWGSGVGVAGSSNGISSGLPSDLWLPAGWRFRTLTGALDVGDNYGAPQYAVEEWIEP